MSVIEKQHLSATDALDRLDGLLDLTNIRTKLADVEEGKGYTTDHLDLMEGEYRKFVAMHLAFPDEDVVPCKIVDEMWHTHILDTIAYRADCDAIFGRYLDHFPYFGMRGDEDAQALNDTYAETLERYRNAFGEPPENTWVSRDAASCKRTACKPQKCH